MPFQAGAGMNERAVEVRWNSRLPATRGETAGFTACAGETGAHPPGRLQEPPLRLKRIIRPGHEEHVAGIAPACHLLLVDAKAEIAQSGADPKWAGNAPPVPGSTPSG